MQNTGIAIEREARRRLPRLLAELLDDPVVHFEPDHGRDDRQIDFVARDGRDRQWLIEVKSSSRPGQISQAVEQLQKYDSGHAIPILVVPYMSPAGAEVADRARLNWIDLSGNAHVRTEGLNVWIQGHPNEFPSRGRPSSPFAPKSARVTRVMLEDPRRWWRQTNLVEATSLDDGNVSRIVRRLDDEYFLERRERELRPRDPALLLDAWAQEYRFSGHDILSAHLSGQGVELSHGLAARLKSLDVPHAFTGLPAAWALEGFASFRQVTVYVDADPREVADSLDIRVNPKGSNVQLVGPNDSGVFAGAQEREGLCCVDPVQVYLDLLQLPERANEAAQHLRSHTLRWAADAE
jgi:hypothetical protein